MDMREESTKVFSDARNRRMLNDYEHSYPKVWNFDNIFLIKGSPVEQLFQDEEEFSTVMPTDKMVRY